MKRWGFLQPIAVLMAGCCAFEVQAQTQAWAPAQTEQAPAWGWKPEDVARYKEYLKPGKAKAKAQPSWNTAVTTNPAEAKPPAPKPEDAKAAETPPAIKAYCQNIEDTALDARFLHQKSELQHLEGELEKRTSALEAKRAEVQGWMERRDEFINKAEGSLVTLYAKIKPDAAAVQLADIDEEAAAALLLKLKPRSASAILDQMDGPKAARLVSVMIGAARRPEKAPPPTPPAPEKAATQQAATAPEAGKDQPVPQPQPAEKKL